MFSIGLRSGDWAGHFITSNSLLRNRSRIAFAVCKEAPSCIITARWLNPKIPPSCCISVVAFWINGTMLRLNTKPLTLPCSNMKSSFGPLWLIDPHIMQAEYFLNLAIRQSSLNVSSCLRVTYTWPQYPQRTDASSVHNTLSHCLSDQFTCSWAHCSRSALCRSVRKGFRWAGLRE